MSIDFRNLNTLWGSILVETLARLGLKIGVVSPGSRSTPLTVALARHPQIETIPILDERSAAFFALGLAKQLYQPVVLVCTSGTATANFYPAVIEAKESHVPLLILTADRPPELRHAHAGQTIDQVKLYGNYPNWQAEISCPSANIERLRYLRQTIIHAWLRCLDPVPGVVHLNLPFRDPLAPTPDLEINNLEANFDQEAFFSHISRQNMPINHSLLQIPSLPPKGIIIAGLASPQNPESYCQAIANLARSQQYPVLAEALSPLRNYAGLNPHLITTYDLLLRNPAIKTQLTPDVVLQIGELPTSKELRTWLEEIDCPRWIIDPHPDNYDPLQGKTGHLRGNIEQLGHLFPEKPDNNQEYRQLWQKLDQKARLTIDRLLAAETKLIEGKIPWLLSQYLPPQTPIFISNSMPVRYAEFFNPPSDRQIRPYFNRGANGIDGNLSTAIGIAYKNVPSLLLTGDLALLHDTNGFLIKNYFVGSLTIILINNKGGGIFQLLPIAKFDPPFEEFFATPQNIDFCQLCHTYGIDYHLISDWTDFQQKIAVLPESGIRLLEISCDRAFNTQWFLSNYV
ncbi:MAG: 2-succinyl-5-enolpyruvyl-6-hydroxy-3-cyclohexene-1-carboxylic-acid synthase [Microcystis aeruginosa G13-11]|nr:2-succinyl-5-enolpyruvyl-6-hydroxy-3-cyclohexene-1-carboxylic-acid synthase [Microcystis aeruginosa G13-11]